MWGCFCHLQPFRQCLSACGGLSSVFHSPALSQFRVSFLSFLCSFLYFSSFFFPWWLRNKIQQSLFHPLLLSFLPIYGRISIAFMIVGWVKYHPLKSISPSIRVFSLVTSNVNSYCLFGSLDCELPESRNKSLVFISSITRTEPVTKEVFNNQIFMNLE